MGEHMEEARQKMTPPNYADLARELWGELPAEAHCDRGATEFAVSVIRAALERVAAEAAKVERDRINAKYAHDCCREYTPCRHGLKEWKR